jgi:hypothetical protein
MNTLIFIFIGAAVGGILLLAILAGDSDREPRSR